MPDLLLGCGSSRERKLHLGRAQWRDLVTCDHNPDHRPDVVHDLNRTPWPWPDDQFDELHAYEVLEHLGRQGDAASFFATFAEAWRILKPGGHLIGTCPSWRSMWAWGDPSHTRVISTGSLVFLDQQAYAEQVGKTAMSDFRTLYRADFTALHAAEDDHLLQFCLQAVKPSRWKAP